MPIRTLILGLLTFLLVTGCAERSATPTMDAPASTPMPRANDFEATAIGAIPEGWRVVAGNWSIVANASAPDGEHVLLSDETPLGETLILDEAAGEWSDLEARVMFNVLGGEKGQAGGIAFRYEDEKNYYVVRYNHNELSWNLFRTIDGDREKFPGTDEGSEAFHGGLGQWTELRLLARGAHIQVFSGATKVIDHTEEDPDAPSSGGVGLWTRYDSKTQFDAWTVEAEG